MTKLLLTCVLPLILTGQLIAQTLILHQSNENGIYQKGEKIHMTLSSDKPLKDSIRIRIDQNFLSRFEEHKIPVQDGHTVVFEQAFDRPASVVVEVFYDKQKVALGAIVAPDEIGLSTKRPQDFDRFWKEQRAALRALPIYVKALPMESGQVDFSLQNVRINTTTSRPVRGYLAKPEKAKPRSLPIVINFHAAGVKGNWCLSNPAIALRNAQIGQGAISFDMNAHGMLNGQSQEYYEYLENYTLKDYQNQGFQDVNDCYFLGMYIRLMRALDYLTSLPEWDGKRILVIGESQGGGQALAAAGLDKRVTAIVATVPAMCDWGGPLTGRQGGWPRPIKMVPDSLVLETAPYFDCSHLLKGCKATLVVEMGLIDYTCPAHGIFAALNQAEGKKLVLTAPYRDHGAGNQPVYNARWQKEVVARKNAFIRDYLK